MFLFLSQSVGWSVGHSVSCQKKIFGIVKKIFVVIVNNFFLSLSKKFFLSLSLSLSIKIHMYCQKNCCHHQKNHQHFLIVNNQRIERQ